MVKLHSKEVKSGCVTTESEFSGSNMYALASLFFVLWFIKLGKTESEPNIFTSICATSSCSQLN